MILDKIWTLFPLDLTHSPVNKPRVDLKSTWFALWQQFKIRLFEQVRSASMTLIPFPVRKK